MVGMVPNLSCLQENNSCGATEHEEARSVATFYALEEQEAEASEDPISLYPLPAGKFSYDADATFQLPFLMSNGEYGCINVDAKSLWKYMQDQKVFHDTGRRSISRSNWELLRDRYAPWLKTPRRPGQWAAEPDPRKWPLFDPALETTKQNDDGSITYFRLSEGREGRKIRRVFTVGSTENYKNGFTEYFEGERDHERLVRSFVHPIEGVTRVDFFLGPAGEERRVRRVLSEPSSSTTAYFEGAAGQGRLVKTVNNESGLETFFEEGPSGPYKTKMIDAEDVSYHYVGENHGQERLVKKTFTDDSALYFAGEAGQEVIVRLVHAFGNVSFFTGERGKERLSHVVSSNGTSVFYKGAKGKEVPIREVTNTGSVNKLQQSRVRV